MMNQYETVFILTPVLSDQQMKEAVEKFKDVLTAEGAEIINEEEWGLKHLAYPILNFFICCVCDIIFVSPLPHTTKS